MACSFSCDPSSSLSGNLYHSISPSCTCCTEAELHQGLLLLLLLCHSSDKILQPLHSGPPCFPDFEGLSTFSSSSTWTLEGSHLQRGQSKATLLADFPTRLLSSKSLPPFSCFSAVGTPELNSSRIPGFFSSPACWRRCSLRKPWWLPRGFFLIGASAMKPGRTTNQEPGPAPEPFRSTCIEKYVF